ncbi:transposase [Collinsella aerofaciens]|uniref:IS110 family transposase n=1 Tax=Collinsella aerofaciens TaxID=74426 RepID=UPI001C032CE8|nr:transposase [Collinsella aerofaciens]
MKAPSTRPAAVLGLDVGKSSHWACLVDRDGEVLASAPVRNRETELDALFASAPAGTLVVVDQFRNIGSLAVRRARAAGLGVAYLPGLAASRAAGLFAGEAKTDERDAAVIARTALGVPDSLSGVPGRGEALEAARALSSQRDHVVACATRDKNRLRAVLLESCPALEAAVDLSDRRWLELLTVPGIGPRTAAQLAVSVDIGRFPDHDHLASYCGIAPRVRSSGTSVRSVGASRRGDARLKSLLIFSCNSLVRSSGRYGEYYRACRARGMGHGRALKAVARKRLRAIYAVMRDRVPYRE